MRDKVCYRLWTDKYFLDKEFSDNSKMYDYLWDIDEDYDTKKDYIKAGEFYVNNFNKEFNTNYTYIDFFGEPRDIGWVRCGNCGQTHWADTECDCEW